MAKKDFKGGLDSLLQDTMKTQTQEDASPSAAIIDNKNPLAKSKDMPKWAQLTKVNVFMSDKQKLVLDDIARQVMRNRPKGKNDQRERITANTVIRALISILEAKSESVNLAGIENEEELTKLLKKSLTE